MAAVPIVAVALRTRTLSRSGGTIALAMGPICLAAGWTWGILLVAFFVSATALGRYGAGARAERTADIVEKGGERDAWQVLANGVGISLAAVGYIFSPSDAWLGAGAGAAAASTADTWATEVGTLSPDRPRSIISRLPVPPGTSGGVTWLGSAAALGGAVFIGLIALLCHWPATTFAAAVAGGLIGCAIDSLLGATFQSKRRCDRCISETERRIHRCGTTTRHVRGIEWLDNDAVNAVSSLAGGIIGLLFVVWSS